jgi:hypothetical protein
MKDLSNSQKKNQYVYNIDKPYELITANLSNKKGIELKYGKAFSRQGFTFTVDIFGLENVTFQLTKRDKLNIWVPRGMEIDEIIKLFNPFLDEAAGETVKLIPSWASNMTGKNKPERVNEQKTHDEFNPENVDLCIKNLKEITNPTVKQKVMTELRNKITDLPYNNVTPWTKDTKSSISNVISYIRELIEEETFLNQGLDILNIIANRCDEKTSDEIRRQFLDKIEAVYEDKRINKNSDLILLMQRLNEYKPELLKKLVIDSIEIWSDAEFNLLLNSIEFYRYEDKESIMNLNRYLLRAMVESLEKKNIGRTDRTEKVYNIVRNL